MAGINLVLPAAGLGNRFRALGEHRPKPLIPVFEIPMILWVLLNFPLVSEDKILVICQKKDNLPRALSDFVLNLPCELDFLEIEGVTEGPASTVALAFDKIGDAEAIIVANTDQFIFADLEPFLEKVRGGDSQGQILTMSANSNAWSYVGRDSEGKIDQVVEKIEISNEATVGIYGWSKSSLAKSAFDDTFQRNIRTNNEFYVAPTYNFMIQEGQRVETVMIGEHGKHVHGLGTPSDLGKFLENPKAKKMAFDFKTRLGVI